MNSIYLNPFDTNSPIYGFGKISRFGQRRVFHGYESPWKNGFQFKFNVSPAPMPRTNNDWNPDKKRDGDWVFGWGVDYYHPTTALTRTTLTEYAPNDSPTKAKTSKPSHFAAGYAKTKSPSMPHSNTPKTLATASAAGAYGKMRQGNASQFLRQRNQQHQRIYGVRLSTKWGNFKPQIGTTVKTLSAKTTKRRHQHRLQLLKRTTATLSAGWLKRKRQSKYDEDLPKNLLTPSGMVFKHRY